MVRAPAPRFALVLALWAGLAFFLFGSVAAHAEPKARGIAVLAHGEVEGGSVHALAQAIYLVPALRPLAMNEGRGLVLLGRAPAVASADASRYAELREGVHDEGAVSRSVLAAIAAGAEAEAVAVVRPSETIGHVQIRLYLAASNTFDVSLYDGNAGDPSWRSEVVRALERRFDPSAVRAPSAASPKAEKRSEAKEGSRAFYRSPWFWAGLGGAVLLGGAALLASHLGSNEDVRIRVEPPRSGVASASLGLFRFGSTSP